MSFPGPKPGKLTQRLGVEPRCEPASRLPRPYVQRDIVKNARSGLLGAHPPDTPHAPEHGPTLAANQGIDPLHYRAWPCSIGGV